MKENLEITRNHGGCPLKDDNIRNSGTPTVEVYDHDKPDRLELMRPRRFDATMPIAVDYTGNQLTSLTESVRATTTADIYAPGSTPNGSYTYDGNGNMISDSRRGLALGYNYLNLPREVKAGSSVKARYTWLTDGSKLRVRDAGSNGFDYLGSLIYKSSSTGLQLETASFGEGVIRASVSSGGGTEVNYFLTDHLGSVRVIVDGNGSVRERNDYYPFGARHVKSDYPQLAANRFKYNGKELQVTGNLDFLDYGARMYDSGLGRWFGVDLMAEKYYNWSPYIYCYNTPINVIDPDGKDGIYITFPNYMVDTETKLGKQPLGHSGVLLIDNKTGLTKYYEYGRYQTSDGTKGRVRNVKISDVIIGKDGMPTPESLNKVLSEISDKSGQGGDIKGAYIKSDKFQEMNDYAIKKLDESNIGKKGYNKEREPYSLTGNNCATFASDVLKQDKDVKVSSVIINTPNNIANSYRKTYKRIDYNCINKIATLTSHKTYKKSKIFLNSEYYESEKKKIHGNICGIIFYTGTLFFIFHPYS